jgi:L-alanine-DL-glutamate epimerase-like enolase superfamily enzyme
MNRRHFLQTVGTLAAVPLVAAEALAAEPDVELEAILEKPVLDLAALREPVRVESLELLRDGRSYLLRSRSQDGVEAITVPHQEKMSVFWPVLLKSVIPVFLKQDARRLEALLWDAYRHQSNYKMQGMALWVCVAGIEMNLLELMARTAKRPLADFFGGRRKDEVAVYFASSNRGNTPEAEVAHLQALAAGSGVKALKFRLGGRMSRNADVPPNRTERLIPLARKVFGDAMTLYGDANSSYDARQGVRIGRLLEEHGYGFFEEPCEFDDLWATKRVADALKLPVALGEQEYSLHRWRWCIANRAMDIVQPDLHYGGGLIRATQVARMASAAGMQVVPHMSGGGLGYLEVVHFASFTPNAGPYMEFKGNADLPVSCATSCLRCETGVVRCPTGVGFGVEIDPAFVAKARVVRLD